MTLSNSGKPMQYCSIGSSPLQASRIWFGAWAAGGWNWGGSDEKESIRTIHAAIDAGVNAVDTAPIYGFGLSEEVVGRAVAGRRDGVVIASKCGLNWKTPEGSVAFRTTRERVDPDHGDITVRTCLSPSFIRTEVENSLKRMNIETIDLYQTHHPDRSTSIEDTMAELLKMKDEGKIREIGACNVNSGQLDRYQSAGGVVSAQQHYSMLDRRIEEDTLPWCIRNGKSLLAYSPLECGLLACQFSTGRAFSRGDYRAFMHVFQPDRIRRLDVVFRALREQAENHGATAAQVTLAWTLAQEGISHVLTGMRSVKQAIENSAAAGLVLMDHEVVQIKMAVNDYIELEREAHDKK
jgi:methylglyoxal reductase